MTYSILARDADTGDLGVAVQSHFFAVGAVVPWGRPGVGVVATQSIVEPAYGPRGLDLLAAGVTADRALTRLLAADPAASRRQVAMLGADGQPAVHTGPDCIDAAAHVVGADVCAQANLVVSPEIPARMVEAFDRATGTLSRRLLTALHAAEDAGGDIRGRQAAAMVVVRGTPTGSPAHGRLVDLRVDDAGDPLGELERLLIHREALGGLLALLEEPGLFSGPLTAPPDVVAAALTELEAAQRAVGPGNMEPTVWRGLLLARAGRDEEARGAFSEVARVDPHVSELVRRLARAGMWDGDPEGVGAVLPVARPS